MAFSQADVDQYKAALAAGFQSVRLADGRTLTAHSIPDSLLLLRRMEQEIAEAAALPPTRLLRMASGGKGVY